MAAAVAEVPIGEGQGGDTRLREPLGEGIQAHLACRAQAVPEDDHGRRRSSGGQVTGRPCSPKTPIWQTMWPSVWKPAW